MKDAPRKSSGPAPPRRNLRLFLWLAALAAALPLIFMGVPEEGRHGAPLHPAPDLPAFPGAEGFGSRTPGGRGGRILEVTNLRDDGPGSLRAACAVAGPRIVTFRVGGTISLARDVEIREPFLTIAGQSAPGGGICLRGATLVVATHDVVIRGLRIRVGDAPDGPWPGSRDALALRGARTRNVIVDHCSFSWALDENMETWFGAHDLTVQWCIISEGLKSSLHPSGDAGLGFLIGDGSYNVSLHHNLFAHNYGRNPLAKNDTGTELVNNVVYDWGYEGTGFGGVSGASGLPFRAQVRGNLYKPGPSSFPDRRPVIVWNGRGSRLFLEDNLTLSPGGEWVPEVLMLFPGAGLASDYLASEPPFTPSGIRIQAPLAAYEAVLSGAGARLPFRDPVDRRTLRSAWNGTGRLIDSQEEAGGWPFLEPGEAAPDADGDGLPDAWESDRGLDPYEPADAARPGPSGYPRIEEYLNGLLETAGSGRKAGRVRRGLARRARRRVPARPAGPSSR